MPGRSRQRRGIGPRILSFVSPAMLLVRHRAGLIEGDHDRTDVHCRLDAYLEARQRDDHALVVLEPYAADTADQGRATSDHSIGPGKIVELVDVVGATVQLADRSAGSDAEAQALHREWENAV